MGRRSEEREELIKLFLRVSNTVTFKLLLIISLLITIISFVFVSNVNDYFKYISIYGGISSIFLVIGFIFSEKYFIKLLKFQMLTLESIEKDLSKLLERSENKKVAVKEIAISLTYLFNLKKENYKTKIYLVFSAVILVLLNYYYPHWDLLNFSIICIVVLGLIIIKESIVEFRIRKGWFGTNKIEAKALIDFLINNSDDIDFTDGNGKLKRTLFPECTRTQDVVKPVEEGVTV